MTPSALPRGLKKKLHDLACFAIGQGWSVSRTNGGHIRFTKAGCATIFTSSSPSDHRAEHNARAQLRRADRQPNSRDLHDTH